jgi:hypothetical protein
MRIAILATTLAFATLFAASPASAAPHSPEGRFPMPAAAFKERVEARRAKAREHVEKRAQGLDANRAKELRQRFAEQCTRVDAEVNKATADGTVTRDEARDVRKVERHPRHGRHDRHARHPRHSRHGHPHR